MPSIEEMIEVSDPLMNDAMVALRRYHEARTEGKAPDEVERLRLLAESAYRAATDYQLHALGHQPLSRH